MIGTSAQSCWLAEACKILLLLLLDFLGHVVSAEAVQPDPKKVSVIRDWPALKDVHGVQQFLGLGNYF